MVRWTALLNLSYGTVMKVVLLDTCYNMDFYFNFHLITHQSHD
jgi:hypothetical protein